MLHALIGDKVDALIGDKVDALIGDKVDALVELPGTAPEPVDAGV